MFSVEVEPVDDATCVQLEPFHLNRNRSKSAPVPVRAPVYVNELGGVTVPVSSEYTRRLGEPVPALVTLLGVEVVMMALATVATVAVVLPSRYSAATPATCGLAMLVPL